MSNAELLRIANLFETDGEITEAKRYGSGHINYTYEATSDRKRYIFQKINTSLFDRPDMLMNNIRLVTEYLREAIKKAGDNGKVLEIVRTKDGGKDYVTVAGDAYRMYEFVEGTVCYEQVESAEDFYNCAYAFGKFATYLDGFDATKLYEVIPNFHNTVNRMKNFERALEKDVCGRAASVRREIRFFISRRDYCSKITSLLESGAMPMRVTHNDTKLNNILFSKETGEAISIIDLDTVMPGSICYDFGDSIRFGCNTAAEDEPDTSRVGFSTELFEAYVKGYIGGFGKITKIERDNLLWGAILMTYECGMRFLTDYLEGDTYFHTSRDGQNLDRAHTQMRMVELRDENFEKLTDIVKKA